MRIKNKLVYGLGINDYHGCVVVEGVFIQSYKTWKHMLERCYSTKYHNTRPTYIGCTVSEEWLSFSNFKRWYDSNYREGMQLDKDILIQGNKIYSANTCRFVPKHINLLLTNCKTALDGLPLGITRNRNSYRASCNNGLGVLLTKTFKTVEESKEWYSSTKKRIVLEQATSALYQGDIDQDIFNALVSIDF